jgi:dihydroorotate dehydrogenase (fumarate)
MGLPNHGYKSYIEYIRELKKLSPKPVIVSIAGMCKDDFLIIVEAFQKESEADILEVNLSCPNVIGKPQIAYDFEAADEIIGKVCAIE